jgi:hypothetical protein
MTLFNVGAVAFSIALGCARQSPPGGATRPAIGVEQEAPIVGVIAPNAEVEPPLPADFPAPVLSEESTAAWATFANAACKRGQPAPPDCKPHGHVTPCRDRDFMAELTACDGSYACLVIARAVEECRQCTVKLWTGAVDKRLEEVGGDCAGVLRFREEDKPHWLDDLDSATKSAEAMACLARSKHPRARFLLAKWMSDPRAKELLLGDPEATRAWIRHDLTRFTEGRAHLYDAWALWPAFDELGVEALPLLPDLRRVAAYPFVDDGTATTFPARRPNGWER